MRQALLKAITFMIFAAIGSAWQAPSPMPYEVLKTARVGGEGGWDYIYADADGRRLLARSALTAFAAAAPVKRKLASPRARPMHTPTPASP